MKTYKQLKQEAKEYYSKLLKDNNPLIKDSVIDQFKISNTEVYKYATIKGYKRIRKQINSIRKYYYVKDK